MSSTTTKIHALWKAPMSFDTTIGKHTITIDADAENGGQNRGPRPKSLLLAGIAGCSGLDTVAILGKMSVTFDRFEIDVEASSAENHPKVYTQITLIYKLWGNAIDKEAVDKAITLSEKKYCGVWAMLRHDAEIQWRSQINPE